VTKCDIQYAFIDVFFDVGSLLSQKIYVIFFI